MTSNTSRRKTIKKSAGILAVLACLAVLAAPAPASAADANWRIFGSLTDTDDLAEAFGGGLRVGFPFKETWEFDISVAYYEDFKNRWEDNSAERINVELSFIPADFGVTWTKDGDSGFQFGLGLTWAYMDINDLNIEGVNVPITGAADNEFGGYVKLGYQAAGGFFAEGMYRLLDASVENLTYAKYFDTGGRLNLQGELAVSVGVIALFFLMSPAITTLPMMAKALGGVRWKRTQRAGYFALLLVVIHLVVLGLKGWLAPKGWHGGLPPISLIAAVAALVPLLVRRKLVHDKHERMSARKDSQDN